MCDCLAEKRADVSLSEAGLILSNGKLAYLNERVDGATITHENGKVSSYTDSHSLSYQTAHTDRGFDRMKPEAG